MKWATWGVLLVGAACSGCFWHERQGDPDVYAERRRDPDHARSREHEERREEHGDGHHEEQHHDDQHHEDRHHD